MAFKIGDKVCLYRNNKDRTNLPDCLIGEPVTVSGNFEDWIEIEVKEGMFWQNWHVPPSYLKHIKS